MKSISKWVKAAAVVGTLGLAVSSASALTLKITATGDSIDFDSSTVTFTNWYIGGINQLGTSGISFAGLSGVTPMLPEVDPTTSFIGPVEVGYNITTPTGTFNVGFSGSELHVGVATVPASFSVVSDFNTEATWQIVDNNLISGLGGDHTSSYRNVTTADITVSITDPATHGNAIPEPLTSAMGLAGLALLGARLTGRRSH